MSIVNRRNALIGWAAWSVGKRVLARKAKGVLPTGDRGGSGRRSAVKVGAVLAAAAGAVAFWKATHRDSTDLDSVASEEIGTPTD